MRGDGTGYDAARIEVLTGLEGVRKRPGMWVGSTTERGLHQMAFEAVGWAVREVLATGAGCVDVTLTADGAVRVADDGPGVPFELPAAEGSDDLNGPGLEALLTRLHAGHEFSGRDFVALSPVSTGIFVVNALSSRLTAEVRHEGVGRNQEYVRGVPLAPPSVGTAATGSGTTITFWPDAEIFTTTQYSFAVLAERFRQVAFLNRGLTISLTDERPAGGPRLVRFRFPGGVRDFVAALSAEAGTAVEPDVIGFEREDPRMAGTMEVALLWGGSREKPMRGFANSLVTFEGGTHVDGFRDGVAAAVTAYARERGLLTAADPDPAPDLIGTGLGLTAIVSVKLDRPEFLGATRTLLGNAEVRTCVREAVQEHLGGWFEEHPEESVKVVDRILQSARPNDLPS